MADPLDIGVRQLHQAENSRLMSRVVRAVQLDEEISFMDALDRVQMATQRAVDAGEPTLRGVLKNLGGDLDYAQQSIKLLERRDAAVERAYEQAAGPILLEQVDAQGRVLLPPAGVVGGRPVAPTGRDEPLTTDVGKVLGDPQEFERRLMRIRRAQSGWEADDGRERFRQQDRANAEVGKDLVRTAERPLELAAARAHAGRVASHLDRAIAEADDKHQTLKLLDAKIAELERTTDTDLSATRDQLQSQMTESGQEPLRMLDQLTSVDAKTAPTLENVQERMRILDRPQSDFLKTLEEIVRGEPEPAPVAEPDVAPGVYPGSHAMAQRVQARMKMLDRPASEWLKTFDEIVAEDARGRE